MAYSCAVLFGWAPQAGVGTWDNTGWDGCDSMLQPYAAAPLPHAAGIICDAVDRYKELCEGKYAGKWGALFVSMHANIGVRTAVLAVRGGGGMRMRWMGSGA